MTKKLICRAIDENEIDIARVFKLGDVWRVEFPKQTTTKAHEYKRIGTAMRYMLKMFEGALTPVPECEEAKQWLIENDDRLKHLRKTKVKIGDTELEGQVPTSTFQFPPYVFDFEEITWNRIGRKIFVGKGEKALLLGDMLEKGEFYGPVCKEDTIEVIDGGELIVGDMPYQ